MSNEANNGRRATGQTAIDGTSDSLLTKSELAPRLRRSVRTIDSWMRQGKLPYLKLGKTVLFRWPDVLEKLNTFRVN